MFVGTVMRLSGVIIPARLRIWHGCEVPTDENRGDPGVKKIASGETTNDERTTTNARSRNCMPKPKISATMKLRTMTVRLTVSL